jgi:hypothetical protein
MSETKQTAVYFAGINAVTFDRPDEPTADADGHIINATVLRREEAVHSLIPVRARVAHGVSPATAASMLRKMADLIETSPELVNAEPGIAYRRLPDGSSVRKKLTPKTLLEAGRMLDEDDRKRLIDLIERLRDDLPSDEDEGGPDVPAHG